MVFPILFKEKIL